MAKPKGDKHRNRRRKHPRSKISQAQRMRRLKEKEASDSKKAEGNKSVTDNSFVKERISCSAFGCTEQFKKGSNINFFKFPTDEIRRNSWTRAVKRRNWSPSITSVLCSKHFQTGKPSNSPIHPDYVPNMFVVSDSVAKHQSHSSAVQVEEFEDMHFDPQSSPSFTDTSEVSEKETELLKLKIELQQAYEEINLLRSEKDAMQKKGTSSDITNRILQDARELHFYTGVRSAKDFHSILALISDVDTSVELFPRTTQLLIVLMKLRLNLNYLDLAFRFQTSRDTVQKLCVKMIPSLEEKLKPLIKCPVITALQKTLPPCYHKNTVFENLYDRIQKYVKSEAKQCEDEDEDADCESL